jgi:hypothetical protein
VGRRETTAVPYNARRARPEEIERAYAAFDLDVPAEGERFKPGSRAGVIRQLHISLLVCSSRTYLRCMYAYAILLHRDLKPDEHIYTRQDQERMARDGARTLRTRIERHRGRAWR